jgi:hypothetical protein
VQINNKIFSHNIPSKIKNTAIAGGNQTFDS